MQTDFLPFLIGVGIFGGMGAVIRGLVSNWSGRLPYGILAVNSVASLVAGFAAAALSAAPANDPKAQLIYVVVVAGFCGGLSTFSSFAANTVELIRQGRAIMAAINAALNFILPVVAVVLGVLLASSLLK